MRAVLGILFLFALVFQNTAQAHLRTLSEAGSPLYWQQQGFTFSGNATNTSGLSAAVTDGIFQNSASRWAAAGSSFSISYGGSLSTAPRSIQDGVNAVYFASQSGETMEYGVVAVTQVLYYTSSGQIAEADVAFNDKQFRFTDNETDTGRAGYGVIYLGDVATHEFGHAIGLDHSTVGNSSMIYTAFAGAFSIGQDDITGIQTIAPAVGGKGSITGRVVGTRGGMFGVHVSAINQATGAVEAGTLSEPNGTFRIGDLPAGSYAVLMEPLGVSSSSISSYWQNVDHRFCANGLYGETFRRAFYSACGSSQVTTVEVSPGRDTAIGSLTPSCAQMGNPSGVPASLTAALPIDARGGARYGTLSPGQVHYYKVTGVAGSISARVASYSIFSNVDTHVDLLNARGELVGATTVADVENPMPGGHINYDASASIENLPYGTYYLRITADGFIDSSEFPTGFELKDASGHYLLMVGVNGEYGLPSVTDMSSCVSVTNVAQSASIAPGRAPDDDQGSGGGCASTTQPPPNDLGSILGGPLMGFLALILFRARRSLAARRFRR